MKSLSLAPTLLIVPCLLAPLHAQGLVGIGVVNGPRTSTAFAPATLGNGITSVAQVGMVAHPAGTPGLFLGGMSVQGLNAALGGAGGMDVVAFTYDRGTDTVTLNNNAASINTNGNEFALNWAPSGLYAVADRGTGVFQATATTAGGTLAAPTAVAGITGLFIDPCPGRVGGADVLFFDHVSGVGFVAHNVAGSSVSGSLTLVLAPSAAGNVCHSAAPLLGADGETQALIACEADATFTTSDWNWQGDLLSATAPVVMQPTAQFENNGTEAGGRVYMVQATATASQVLEWDVVGVLGDTVASAGGQATLTAFSPIKSVGQPDATVLINGFPGFALSPLAIPGIGNLLGIDVAILTVPGVIVHNPATGRGSLSFNMPPFQPGTDITLQGLTLLDLGAGPTVFTNTFTIHVQ